MLDVDTLSDFDRAIPLEQRRSILGPPHGTLPELGRYECRWPVGHPENADFFFCGAVADEQPYCKQHRQVAYARPPKDSRPTNYNPGGTFAQKTKAFGQG